MWLDDSTGPMDADFFSFLDDFSDETDHCSQPCSSSARYVEVDAEKINQLLVSRVPKTTQRKQDWCMRLFREWLRRRNFDKDLASLESKELNEMLVYFIPSVRKVDGKQYPPRTLKEIVALIQHHFNYALNRNISIFNDPEFEDCRRILDATMKESAMNGNVRPVRRAEVVTVEMENRMWNENVLGDTNPRQLVDTLVFYLGLHLCLRASQEHRDLRFGVSSQLKLLVTASDEQYLEYTENFSKNKRFGIKHSKMEPKVVHIFQAPQGGDRRCVVSLVKKYISHRCV